LHTRVDVEQGDTVGPVVPGSFLADQLHGSLASGSGLVPAAIPLKAWPTRICVNVVTLAVPL